MTLSAPSVGAGELRDQRAPRPVLATEVVLSGAVWDVRRDRVDLGEAGQVERDYVQHPGAVGVVALREDRGRAEIVMIQQYRHPVRALEWELPAGLLDVSGEPAWDAAARELAEETDLRAATWHVLLDYVSSPGGSSEALSLYLARDLSDVPVHRRHTRDGEEHGMPVRWVDLDVALEAVLAGRVRNVAAVAGVLAAAHHQARGWRDVRAVD